jgi:protocatechuate 3,4-dioxygenase, beta subunit
MKELVGYRHPFLNTQPEYLVPAYGSTVKRSPTQPLVQLESSLSELTGPRFDPRQLGASANDLTTGQLGQKGEPLGERIWVSGRVLDDWGKPVPNTLVEIWQCNSAGRYLHEGDQHHAPLDPNFTGVGQVFTDADGRYRFKTIRPGAYPWRNHHNAWRPAHIHFSLFGSAWATRLVTQMYFPGDPLLEFDPIFHAIHDEQARKRLVSAFDWETTEPELALGYRFDIVLRGRLSTPIAAARAAADQEKSR